MPVTTFETTANLPVNLSGQNNPGDAHLPIGRWDPATGLSWDTRVLLKAPVSFGGMTTTSAARPSAYQHTAAGWHAKGSGTVGIEVFRKTTDWSEARGGDSTDTNESWGGSGASLVTTGVAGGNPDRAINIANVDSFLTFIDMTAIVQAWKAG